jgi:Plasmid pRiA4b ORF-3-like protein
LKSARATGWGLPDPDWPDGPLDARKAKLMDVLEDAGTKTLRYLYDFGDGWEHTIKVERLANPEPNAAYPRLIEASGRCPPEDVGGSWGYAEMIEALGDPKHERHDEMREWAGDDFDPHAFDAERLKDDVAVLAKRWAKKPTRKKS